MVNNVTVLGHSHPRVARAIADQWRTFNSNSRFHYASIVELAEKLTALLPESLDTVFLVNSGSEAVELALRLARVHTGREDLLAVRDGYHGWTYLADAVSTSSATIRVRSRRGPNGCTRWRCRTPTEAATGETRRAAMRRTPPR